MSLFSQNALKPGVRRREVFGWAMYDFANSGYTTVVLTAVFSAYFVGGIAGGEAWGTLAWTSALAVSSLVVMFTMPALGAYADLRAAKKRLLVLSTLGCVLGTAALAGAGPGEVAWTLVAIVLYNAFYSYGESLISVSVFGATALVTLPCSRSGPSPKSGRPRTPACGHRWRA